MTIVGEQAAMFKAIWKTSAPSKVEGFSWMVLHNRIPTKDNLFLRKIIQNEGECACVMCGIGLETVEHLLLYCDVAIQVWGRVLSWLGMEFYLPHNLMSLLNFLADVQGRKQMRKGLIMIWQAVIWALWRHRNKIVFENGITDVIGLVEEVKISSWKWWIARSQTLSCLFYEWNQAPTLCLLR
ncbi:hypothetical protein L195_g050013 [Trifolium pratense]|uniref:Reverse transcriptase zinc-binding domain-containing protein n=1 Tax=Trifolium pratense TaxID=57577 RepID=A0A2K3JRN6_TRIPR|nr:hypothetical protein L195_g050013 [Trifolium pratense]